MIGFNNRNPWDIEQALNAAGIVLTIDTEAGIISCTEPESAQAIIDSLPEMMPDLLPVQLHYLLARNGFDDVIDLLLANLKSEDLDKYAMYKAYLSGARFYEFDKTLAMFNEIRSKFTDINASLNFTDDQLKLMWTEASLV